MRVVRIFQIRISIFDPQMTVISVKCGDVIKINHTFGPFIDIVHKNKLHRWIPEMKLNQKSALYFQNVEFWKLTFFTWPWGQIWKLPLPLDSTSKITYITCVARLSYSFPHDDLMWPDRDLGLYLL